ncbi:MAG: adenosylcobinamide-phosphate synthase CbiB [bacterium]|nr:adenosylcobinamide-phosphate synthase CbiB [bacterium]
MPAYDWTRVKLLLFTCISLAAGYVLDLALGERLSAICPAVIFGKLIAALERLLRGKRELTGEQLRRRGAALVIVVCAVAFIIPLAILIACWLVTPYLYLLVSIFWCYQILATRGLRDAGMDVYKVLVKGDIEESRNAVGMIVGRDTDQLDEEGIAKATVETIAENASDGSIVPMFYFAIGGAPLSMLSKAINTMDSMLGYKNERYIDFGRMAAKLDDVANYIPARLAGLFFVIAAIFPKWASAWRAFKIWRRDRRKSPSPNSAQSESAVAGALGIELLGDAVYFGELHHKETIGDPIRPIEPDDIIRANRLMFIACSIFCALLVCIELEAVLLF